MIQRASSKLKEAEPPRHLHGEFNVFKGLFNNGMFCGIWVLTAVLQIIMVQFSSHAIHVYDEGLSADLWLWSIIFGVGSFPVQIIINAIYPLAKDYKPWRKRKQKMSSSFRELSVQSA